MTPIGPLKKLEKYVTNKLDNHFLFNYQYSKNEFTITEGPCLMRLLVLGKIRISQMFGSCDLPNVNFGLFISLVRFFGYFCPIWLMRILVNANFFQNQKSHETRTLCISFRKLSPDNILLESAFVHFCILDSGRLRSF